MDIEWIRECKRIIIMEDGYGKCKRIIMEDRYRECRRICKMDIGSVRVN